MCSGSNGGNDRQPGYYEQELMKNKSNIKTQKNINYDADKVKNRAPLSEADAKTAINENIKKSKSVGRKSTILTGSFGLQNDPSLYRKTLLGQ